MSQKTDLRLFNGSVLFLNGNWKFLTLFLPWVGKENVDLTFPGCALNDLKLELALPQITSSTLCSIR